MTNLKNFFLFILLISILGGVYSLRELTKPKVNQVYLNTMNKDIVVIDSIKNDFIFTHSKEIESVKKYKESNFAIFHKKIK